MSRQADWAAMRANFSPEIVSWTDEGGEPKEVVLMGTGAHEAARLLVKALGEPCRKPVIHIDDYASWCHLKKGHRGKCRDHAGRSPTTAEGRSKA